MKYTLLSNMLYKTHVHYYSSTKKLFQYNNNESSYTTCIVDTPNYIEFISVLKIINKSFSKKVDLYCCCLSNHKRTTHI